MAIPPDGWTAAPERADVTRFRLPAEIIFRYSDPERVLTNPRTIEHLEMGAGLAEIRAVAGQGAEGAAIDVELAIGGVYSVLLLDNVRVPPAFGQCAVPTGSSFDQCAGPAAGAWWACN